MSTNTTDDSVFDDVLKTPPTTNATTGTWDDEGPIRGWEFRSKKSPATILDFVLEQEWNAHGLTCLLIRITEYFESGRHTRDSPD